MNEHRAIVIHSPHAGRSRQLSHALTALCAAGIEIKEVLPITDLVNMSARPPCWKASGISLIVAAGGDGLVGGIADLALQEDLPVGIVPLGTANDLARSVGLPLGPAPAARLIASGREREIDLGQAWPVEQLAPAEAGSDPSGDCPFLAQSHAFVHALGVGLSVQFAQMATDTAVRQRYGRFTYAMALWHALSAYQPVEIEMHIEGLALWTAEKRECAMSRERVVLRGCFAQVTAVNAPVFWGPFKASVPGVSFDDRLLDVVAFEESSRHVLLRSMLHFFGHRSHQFPDPRSWHARFPSLYAAELTDVPGVHHFRARRVTFFSPGGRQSVTMDREVRACAPIQAAVSAERLRLIVPEAAASVHRVPIGTRSQGHTRNKPQEMIGDARESVQESRDITYEHHT